MAIAVEVNLAIPRVKNPVRDEKGYPIDGLDAVARMPDVKVFHAGTRSDGHRIVNDGGRVLGVTALGDTIADARRIAYDAVGQIHFHGGFYRRDIGSGADRGSRP